MKKKLKVFISIALVVVFSYILVSLRLHSIELSSASKKPNLEIVANITAKDWRFEFVNFINSNELLEVSIEHKNPNEEWRRLVSEDKISPVHPYAWASGTWPASFEPKPGTIVRITGQQGTYTVVKEITFQ